MNKIRIAGAAAGAVLVSGVVLQVSSAAFESETRNDGNDWAAGTVYLSDNDTAALYDAQGNITPGYEQVRCIEVTYEGTVIPTLPITMQADVITSAADITTDGGDGLADDLQVSVVLGSSCDALTTAVGGLLPAGSPVYSGPLDAFTNRTTTWTPTATDEMRAFRFTVELPTDAANDAQGDTAEANFVWKSSS